MPFNSISFLLFFSAIFCLNHLLARRHRWYLGLAASILFYSLISIKPLLLLIAACLLDYIIGISIPKSENENRRKLLLITSLSVTIFLIFIFKYLNLVNTTTLQLLNSLFDKSFEISHFNLIVPAGISFYCFKKMSYVIDIYKRNIIPERNFALFFLYISHFLEILSGPIDRSKHLLPQLRNPAYFDTNSFQKGLFLILWGLFMKVVIADRLAIYSDAIFNNVVHHNGPSLVLAAYFYSFQIYSDFAGYTFIALGCGKLLGLELSPNFNLPYFSTSISDFWRRWHMTLSYWFRDYLYIPLGGNRVSTFNRFRNLMIVFLLCGLWHGSNWTFVVWGGIHGAYLITALLTKKLRVKLCELLRLNARTITFFNIIITFHLVTFAWIFFRANSLDDAWFFATHLFHNWPNLFIDMSSMAYGAAGIGFLLFFELLRFNNKINIDTIVVLPTSMRWGVYYVLLFTIILLGVGSESAFIYYQF